MFTLTVENKHGARLDLTQDENKYQVINIDGLNPPNADITTNTIANMDGAKYKISRVEMRNIVLLVKINGEVEANRLALYNFFVSGKWCKIYYANDSRRVYIEGYVETIEGGLFTNNEQIQISIVCPEPFFKGLATVYTDISKLFANFEFPFDIDKEGKEFSIFDIYRNAIIVNYGEVATGMIITLTAETDGVENPIIRNANNTLEWFKLNITLNEGEQVIINTNKGHKSIKKVVNGIVSNAFNNLEAGSTWLQLEVGQNLFFYEADENEEHINIQIESETLYEGV